MRLLLAMGVTLLASGCGTILNTAGSDEYGCTPGEAKVTCRTPTAIYRSTNGSPPVAETDSPVAWSKLIRGTSGALVEEQPDAAAPIPGVARSDASGGERRTPNERSVPGLNAQTLGLVGATIGGRPVREPAQVMRIWIAPWIDKNDDLHYPSYLFTEVQARRWTFGKQAFAGRGVVVPHKDFASTDPQRSTASAAEQAPRGFAKPATPTAEPAEGSSSADFSLPN
ncbi:TraV family lipoprotein [Methylibium petroleiphilum]|nr:TraV family lipoprotein [Methylibium petroleiphilum]